MNKPTKPGFYWAKDSNFEWVIVELHHWWDESIVISMTNYEYEWKLEDCHFANFIGPIEPPKTNGTRKYCVNCVHMTTGRVGYCTNE